jgi:hypothetical protein
MLQEHSTVIGDVQTRDWVAVMLLGVPGQTPRFGHPHDCYHQGDGDAIRAAGVSVC